MNEWVLIGIGILFWGVVYAFGESGATSLKEKIKAFSQYVIAYPLVVIGILIVLLLILSPAIMIYHILFYK